MNVGRHPFSARREFFSMIIVLNVDAAHYLEKVVLGSTILIGNFVAAGHVHGFFPVDHIDLCFDEGVISQDTVTIQGEVHLEGFRCSVHTGVRRKSLVQCRQATGIRI